MVNHGIEGHFLAIFLVAAFGFSKVHAAGEFSHTEDVEAVGDEFLFDR